MPTENEITYALCGVVGFGIFGGATGIMAASIFETMMAFYLTLGAHALGGWICGFYSGRDLDRRIDAIRKRRSI